MPLGQAYSQYIEDDYTGLSYRVVLRITEIVVIYHSNYCTSIHVHVAPRNLLVQPSRVEALNGVLAGRETLYFPGKHDKDLWAVIL